MSNPTPEQPQQPAQPQYQQPVQPQPAYQAYAAPATQQYPADPAYAQPYGYAAVPGYAAPPAAPRMGGLSIATFVVSFFLGFVAVILGVFALRQNWVRGTRGNGLAWAGIIIGTLNGVFWTFILMILFWAATR